MSYNLFLDDIRHPYSVYEYLKDTKYLQWDWIVVRNYDEFISHITSNGLPKFISFDHDLADEHYTPQEYWKDYELSKAYQESVYSNYKEKTGLECAKWLVELCLDKDLLLPEFVSHSQNPVGKDNIERYLTNFKLHQINSATK
jgi:hypothetical protein